MSQGLLRTVSLTYGQKYQDHVDEERVWPVFLALLPKHEAGKTVGEIWEEAEAIAIQLQRHLVMKAQQRQINRRIAMAFEKELNSLKPLSEKRKALDRLLEFWGLLQEEEEGEHEPLSGE